MKQFSLGKKIKNLRLTKGMTQAELAGETITRNMLSQIENETAQPSINTILELSEKLGTPTEYFFSEINEVDPFRKLLAIEKIRKSFAAGDYGKCIYRLDRLNVSDDETEYLYAKSYFGLAQELYREGRLTASEEYFKKALLYAENTSYMDQEFSGVVFKYLQTIQSVRNKEDCSLNAEESDQIKNFLSDVMYPDLLEKNSSEVLVRNLALPYVKHLLIHRKMQEAFSNEEAYSFMQQLREILNGLDEKTCAILKYYILHDLEILAQRTGDYKCAYECSSARLQLSEKMNT